MITVSKTSWHFRLYYWYMSQRNRCTPKAPNLCPYVRPVFLWAPLRWVLWDGELVPRAPNGLAIIIVAGLAVAGRAIYRSPLECLLILSLAACMAAPVVIGIALHLHKSKQKAKARRAMLDAMTPDELVNYYRYRIIPSRFEEERKERKWLRWAEDKILDPIADAFILVGGYIRAGHDKICPQIEVK